jgi:hypothetical protein
VSSRRRLREIELHPGKNASRRKIKKFQEVKMIDQILQGEIRKRGMSVRQAAREIGIAHTTLQRVMDGKHADLVSYSKISSWVGVELPTLLELKQQGDVSTQIQSLLEKNPRLLAEFQERIRDGVSISPNVLEDIVEYIVFKLRINSE